MYRLLRRASDRKGRYQLRTKGRKKISDRIHKSYTILLTCAKRYDSSLGGTEQARIDAVELAIDDACQLRVTGRLFAARRRRHDAVEVQRVVGVFTVRDSGFDQSLLIIDPR